MRSVPIMLIVGIVAVLSTTSAAADSRALRPSVGSVVINTQGLTFFTYKDSDRIVYSVRSNEEENKEEPLKWSFHYMPIMEPATNDTASSIRIVGQHVKVKLLMDTEEVRSLARKAITRKYKPAVVAEAADVWDVSALAVDALSAYVVTTSGSVVEAVYPYVQENPTQRTITLSFECHSSSTAREVVQNLLDGIYEIRAAFHYAGLSQVATSVIAVTGRQVKNVNGKTVADGGNPRAQFIHRSQGNTFTAKYLSNVKTIIYQEDPSMNVTQLSLGLWEKFVALFQKGITMSEEYEVQAGNFQQIWSSRDLDPDVRTSEINKKYTLHMDTSQTHNTSENVNKSDRYQQSSNGNSYSAGIGLGRIFFGVKASHSNSQDNSDSLHSRQLLSLEEVKNRLRQEDIHVEWTGEQLRVKSFVVYKISDLTSHLQAALFEKHMKVVSRGALLKNINLASEPRPITTKNPFTSLLTGEIRMFPINQELPPLPWLLCDGSAVSRLEYRALFRVIGERFGAGDGRLTFNLPDFRGRFPVGEPVSPELTLATKASGDNSTNHLNANIQEVQFIINSGVPYLVNEMDRRDLVNRTELMNLRAEIVSLVMAESTKVASRQVVRSQLLHRVNGNWSSWSEYSTCDQATGLATRTRTCNNPPPSGGGALCQGANQEMQICRVDGGWSEWSEFSPCDYQRQSQMRTRECTNPSPQFGGSLCVGNSSEQRYCQRNCSSINDLKDGMRFPRELREWWDNLEMSSDHHDFKKGDLQDGDEVLFIGEVQANYALFEKVTRLVEVRTKRAGQVITAVACKDQWRDGSGGYTKIIEGGVGQTMVKIQLLSQGTRGLQFIVAVFGNSTVSGDKQ